jgi:hypothetical protein
LPLNYTSNSGALFCQEIINIHKTIYKNNKCNLKLFIQRFHALKDLRDTDEAIIGHFSKLNLVGERDRSTIIFGFFCWLSGTGVWTQGLMLAGQAPYHLSHLSALFLCWVFSNSRKLSAEIFLISAS